MCGCVNGIDLEGADHVEPSLLEPEREAPDAGEDVQHGWPRHEKPPSRKRAHRSLMVSGSEVSHCQTMQLVQLIARRSLT